MLENNDFIYKDKATPVATCYCCLYMTNIYIRLYQCLGRDFISVRALHVLYAQQWPFYARQIILVPNVFTLDLKNYEALWIVESKSFK